MLLFSYLVTVSPHQSISFMRKHLSLCIPCSTSKTLPSAWQRVGSQQITMKLMKWYYHIQTCNCHLMSTYTTRIMLESALQLLYLLPTKCQGECFHYPVRTTVGLFSSWLFTLTPLCTTWQEATGHIWLLFKLTVTLTLGSRTHKQAHTHSSPLKTKRKCSPTWYVWKRQNHNTKFKLHTPKQFKVL